MITRFSEFLCESKQLTNYLNNEMVFKNLSEILMYLNYKDSIKFDENVYKEVVQYALNKGGFSENGKQTNAIVFAFLEAWDTLSNIKIDEDLANEIVNDIKINAGWKYIGGKSNYTAANESLKMSLQQCRTGAEYLYAIHFYCQDLGMSYPIVLQTVLKERFGKIIYENYKIVTTTAYILRVTNVNKTLLGIG